MTIAVITKVSSWCENPCIHVSNKQFWYFSENWNFSRNWSLYFRLFRTILKLCSFLYICSLWIILSVGRISANDTTVLNKNTFLEDVTKWLISVGFCYWVVLILLLILSDVGIMRIKRNMELGKRNLDNYCSILIKPS